MENTSPFIRRAFAMIAFAAALVASDAVAETPSRPLPPPSADRVEEVQFFHNGRRQTETGRIISEPQDGGLLLQTPDGMLWSIERRDLFSRRLLEMPFTPLTADELGERLVAQMPPGFRIYTTPHYVVCYNTSREYAQWTSSLLERLYKAFTSYWKQKGLDVREPEFPLPVLVFADRSSYDAAAREDLPGGTGSIVGFYSLRSNRTNMFDLTGAEAVRGAGARRGSMKEITQLLSQPAAVPLVATVVHEATHQIAFNCGLQTRYADIPLWQCEGMAVYFEAPDLASTRGWRGIGKVNYPRLETFRRNLPRWNDRSLPSLLADSRRFRDPRTASDAYADAWALNYYLIKYRPDAYAGYLKMLAEKRPLVEDDSQTRLAEFREHFGDLRSLEQDFLKQMGRVK
jgi:Protein of unknown function (DUF1570)